jgi:endonuclease/exonuclease/phosphatase family metal-dependent hydrolase
VATYNVENYGLANRLTDSGYRRDYPKPEAEKQALRSVIRDVAADVLVLQEIGGRGYLEELQRDLRREGLDYPYAELGEGSDAERHVALLSRLPLKAVRRHARLEFSYLGGRETVKRGLLEAVLKAPGGDVTVFAVHLKSRLTDHPDDPLSSRRRAGEATAIRDLILRSFPVPSLARFLILGDCNDGRVSKALGFLQKRGRTVVAHLLTAEDTRGETWTHYYRREETYSRVDHILVSPALRPEVRGARAHIHDGPGVRQASDHRPVVVVLQGAGRPAPAVSGQTP